MGIAAILAEVGAQVSYLQKQGNNSAQGYKYARAEDVFRAVNKELSKHNVACVHSTSELLDIKTGLGRSGNQTLVHVRITQTYRHDESGETATFQGTGSGADSGDKGAMKASTAALKYLLAAAFNISWGDDPEATDPETGETTGGKAKKERKPSAAKQHKELLDKIAKAATASELEAFKPAIKAMDNQTREYKEAKDAYMARTAQLSA